MFPLFGEGLDGQSAEQLKMLQMLAMGAGLLQPTPGKKFGPSLANGLQAMLGASGMAMNQMVHQRQLQAADEAKKLRKTLAAKIPQFQTPADPGAPPSAQTQQLLGGLQGLEPEYLSFGLNSLKDAAGETGLDVGRPATPASFDMGGYMDAIMPDVMASDPMGGLELYAKLAEAGKEKWKQVDLGNEVGWAPEDAPWDVGNRRLAKKRDPQVVKVKHMGQEITYLFDPTTQKWTNTGYSSPDIINLQPGGTAVPAPEVLKAASAPVIDDPNWTLSGGSSTEQPASVGKTITSSELPGLRVAKPLEPAQLKTVDGAIKIGAMLSDLSTDLEGYTGMEGPLTWLRSKFGDDEAGRVVKNLDNLKFTMQMLVEGVPTDKDMKLAFETIPQLMGSDAENKAAMGIVVRGIVKQMRSNQKYWKQNGYDVPAELEQTIQSLLPVLRKHNTKVVAASALPSNAVRGEDGYWYVPDPRDPKLTTPLMDSQTLEFAKWR